MKLKMFPFIISVILIVSGTASIAYGSRDVLMIKSSVLKSHQSTTIGKAFDASFDEPKWEQFEGRKGERVVQFTGKISTALHDTVATVIKKNLSKFVTDPHSLPVSLDSINDQLYNIGQEVKKSHPKAGLKKRNRLIIEEYTKSAWAVGTPVTVKFIVTPNGRSFRLVHMDSKAWEGMKYSQILDMIYS
jgi:hypothetical protein